jgi:adenylate cyclase
MTVLFADLVGFTSLSERLTPSVMVTLLKYGISACRPPRSRNTPASVDKFVGDSIMAFWGPPFVRPEEHAALACRAARAQLLALDTLRRELPELNRAIAGMPPPSSSASGSVPAKSSWATSGRRTRVSYTVIGDSVNVAARLERANRLYGTHALISETTAQAIGSQFELREIDTISLKGKTETTRVFELLSVAGAQSSEEMLPLARALRARVEKLCRPGLGYSRVELPRMPPASTE